MSQVKSLRKRIDVALPLMPLMPPPNPTASSFSASRTDDAGMS